MPGSVRSFVVRVTVMGIRVLVVEDESDIADFMVRGLREEGFTVEHAGDGDAAWHALQAIVGPGAAGLASAGTGRPHPAAPVPASGERHAGAVPDGARRRFRPRPGTGQRSRRLSVQALRLQRTARPGTSLDPPAGARDGHAGELSGCPSRPGDPPGRPGRTGSST